MNQEISNLIDSATSGRNPRKALSAKEVATGLTAYYVNADGLLTDAWLLIQNSRLPRAISLTVLALEELSKVHQMHDFYLQLQLQDLPKKELTKPWQELWKAFTKHGEKQKAIEGYGKATRDAKGEDTMFGSSFLPYFNYLPEEIASKLDALKQRCFYVDYADMNFAEPRSSANTEVIDYLYSVATERLYSFGPMHGVLERSMGLLNRKNGYISECLAANNDSAKIQAVLDKYKRIDDRPPSTDEEIARLDFLYWLSHRSSSVVPDYASFWSIGAKSLSKLDKAGVNRVISGLLEKLEEKLEVEDMPRITHRHWQMIKLIRSFSEKAVADGLLRKRHFDAIFA